jgi:uncharacterized protein YdeI (BOF family)
MPNVDTLLSFDEDSAGLLWNGNPVLQSITVSDEGIVICDTVHTINFKGANVQAKDCVDGVVNVYVPPPQYVSNFNTFDGGVGDTCVVGDKSVTSRWVAEPTSEGSPYNIGSWFGATPVSVNAIKVSEAAHSYTTTNVCSFVDDSTTTIEVNVYDADGVSTLASHTTAAITGNTSPTFDNITIDVSSFGANVDQYQGIIAVTFNIDTILGGTISGRYGVEIIHHNAANGDFTYTQTPLYFDNESNVQTIADSVTVAENTPVIVRKSGVYHYDTGSTFTVNIGDMDWLNSDSYPTTLVSITGSDYNLPILDIDGASLTSWTTKYNIMNVSYANAAWAVGAGAFFTITTTANISAQVKDWSPGASDSSPNASVIIDTYNDDSTRVVEDFKGETERLKADDLSTSWDSTQDITGAYDSGNGLQVGDGSYLFYPKNLDYGAYEPSSGSQPNYTGETGNKTYIRGMDHPGNEHSNGQFVITGTIDESDITNDDIVIEISLDGSVWFKCNDEYPGGVIGDGDGCRVDPGGNPLPNLEFTFGTGKNTDSGSGPDGDGIWLRITMPTSSAVVINKIEIDNWN